MPGREEAGTVLVIDDDGTFVRLVTALLRREGHDVVVAADAETALDLIDRQRFDLIVLDIEMPGMSGLELLSRIKPRVDVPVIVVSGREAESERVLALDLGADDYVVKPFLSREFAARIRAALRRSRHAPDVTYAFDGIEIRVGAREVTVGGRPVAFSPREFDVLAYLAARAGRVVSRDQLLEDVWRSSADWQDSATVTEHIRRIRRKLEAHPAQARRITSVRNVGYRFEPDAG
ncbi:MAG: response regulator transcription factor [Acidimicrobiales bacterium]